MGRTTKGEQHDPHSTATFPTWQTADYASAARSSWPRQGSPPGRSFSLTARAPGSVRNAGRNSRRLSRTRRRSCPSTPPQRCRHRRPHERGPHRISCDAGRGSGVAAGSTLMRGPNGSKLQPKPCIKVPNRTIQVKKILVGLLPRAYFARMRPCFIINASRLSCAWE